MVFLLTRATSVGGSAEAVLDPLLTVKDREGLDRLLDLARRNGVSPALYLYFSKDRDVSPRILERLKKKYLGNLRRNAGHLEETLKILRELKRAGIGAIPLKGSLMAETLLGDMGIYPTSDIDILIRPDDLEAAVSAFEEIGYFVADQQKTADLLRYWYDINLTGPDFTVELHWNLAVRYFQIDPGYWWEGAVERSFRGETYLDLSREKMLIANVLNIFKHRFYPLRIFTPLQALIRNETFEWEIVFAEARRIRAERLLKFILGLTAELYDFDLPEAIRPEKLSAYSLLRNNVLKGFASGGGHPYLRMLLFVLLLDSPWDAASFVARRLVPPMGEIRLRYGLPAKSRMVYVYYALNPFLMLLKKH